LIPDDVELPLDKPDDRGKERPLIPDGVEVAAVVDAPPKRATRHKNPVVAGIKSKSGYAAKGKAGRTSGPRMPREIRDFARKAKKR
jgi:hypothetical protein